MYRIISDLGADIPPRFLGNEQLTVINQPVIINGCERTFDINSADSMKSFYALMQTDVKGQTRAMSDEEINAVLDAETLTDCEEFLVFSFSSVLSATGSIMERCCNEASQKYGKRFVYFDTKTATAGQALVVLAAINNRRMGVSLSDNIRLLNEYLKRIDFFVLLNAENRFAKGGRAGKDLCGANNAFPTLLYLPIGSLYKKTARFLSFDFGIKYLTKYVFDNAAPNTPIIVCHGSNESTAKAFADNIGELCNCTAACAFANPVMGIHTGDNAVLVAYARKR